MASIKTFKLAIKFLLILICLIYLLGCGARDVYDFYAHKHQVPMFGNEVQTIPSETPLSQKLYKPVYQQAGNQALNLIAEHKKKIFSPGISAAVAIDGELTWSATAGWADISAMRAMTNETQFRIGSTSKALTSALLARLIESNKLSLDTPLANFAVSDVNPKWSAITPRQLASHTAGIPHYNKNNDWSGLYQTMAMQDHYANVSESLMLFDESDLLFSPGEDFEYSSLGTVLLSAVLQEASGQRFQDAMQQRVLNPLKMTRTEAESSIAERAETLDDIATFYWHEDYDGNRVRQWREVDLSHRLAAGGYLSTPTDLVKLGLGFLSNEFISSELTTEFWTPQTLNNGEVNNQNYAIGWRVRETEFGEQAGTLVNMTHGGVSRGAQSWLMVIPKYQMVVAININAKTKRFWDFAEISHKIATEFIEHRLSI